MTETWLQWCIQRPGPSWKGGYSGVPALGTLDEKEGEVKHSAEGSLSALFGELDRPDREASWTFSLAKDGKVFQHYPLEWRGWHCGLPGDRRRDTSLVGNLTLIGEEHEGGGPLNPGEPLTEAQYQSNLRLSRAVREVCPHIGASPPTLKFNLWEHRWLSSTSCPSGRIPWVAIIAALQTAVSQEEDHMPKMRFIKAPTGPTWVTDGIYKMGITTPQISVDLVNLGLAEPGEQPVAQEFVDWLINYPKDRVDILVGISAVKAAGGSGPSAAEIVDELAKRLQD